MRNGWAFLLLALLTALMLWGCSKDSPSQAEAEIQIEEGCVECHGLPPVSPCDEPTGWERVENYPGGGATHAIHVDFIRAKIEEAGLTPTLADLCAPCHGTSPGEATHHNESDTPECWEWTEAVQAKVDLIDGAGNFGPDALYNGTPVLTTASTKGGEPQQCASFDCHGASAPVSPEMALLWDFTCEEYATDDSVRSVYNEWGRDITCAGCHGHDPATPELRTRIIIKAEGATVYDSDDPRTLPHGVAANYFGTVSSLGYGGHGDAQINDVDDPSFRDSAPGWELPLSCNDCHDGEAPHYPVDSANTHRLSSQTVEDFNQAVEGLCSSCHAAHYAANHHAYNSTPGSVYTIMSPVDETTQWVLNEYGGYGQTAYGAANTQGDVDYYVNEWGDSLGIKQTPPPAPEPFSVMPLAQHLMVGIEGDQILCVTCHNPHGTDLSLQRSRMLRVSHEDSALCCVCHCRDY